MAAIKLENSKLYINRVIELIKKYYENITNEEAQEIAESGYNNFVQIQPSDDNFTGRVLKHEDSRVGGEHGSNVLDYFTYRNKKYFLVVQ